jgi:hypothetical protein
MSPRHSLNSPPTQWPCMSVPFKHVSLKSTTELEHLYALPFWRSLLPHANHVRISPSAHVVRWRDFNERYPRREQLTGTCTCNCPENVRQLLRHCWVANRSKQTGRWLTHRKWRNTPCIHYGDYALCIGLQVRFVTRAIPACQLCETRFIVGTRLYFKKWPEK